MPDTELVRKLLLQWDENTASTPEELCRPYSDRPDYGELLQAVREAMDASRAVAPSTKVSSDSWRTRPPAGISTRTEDQALCDPAIDSPPAGLRYRPVAQHRRGGLGEVLVADDTELHRKVALKRIRVDRCHDTSSQREFLREAEITARLEHPGVVPVHGLVQDADGQPYYAMRFIEGESLHDAIQRFHEADKNAKRDPGERSLALRELLNRFIAVCNTIAYAHSRGVLHRDLKPQNIMLGKYGETLVVDWGLAKSFERSEEARATGEETVRPASQQQEGHETRPGDVKGTPAYMSPEQASGRIDQMGPGSDIFALGATLYAILTGVAPYRGNNAVSIAGRAEFMSPRQVKPHVSPGLEAICLKAMALRPEGRYATAKELADDVEKWLADEPVIAWQEPFAVRARRWMRRHRGLMSAGAATLVVALISSIAAVVFFASAEKREQRLREAAQEKEQEALDEKALAEASHKRAIEALGATTDEIVEQLIGAKPTLGPVERAFLRSTLDRWQSFAAEEGESEQARADRAEGTFRVAHIRQQLGEHDEAISGYRQAIGLYEKLSTENHAVEHYRVMLAGCHNNLGNLLHKLGKNVEAAAAIRQALKIKEKIAADYPDVPKHGRESAGSHTNLGNILRELGKYPEAEAEFNEALKRLETLAADYPAVAEYRVDLAASYNNLGVLLRTLGRHQEAEAVYRKALGVQEKLAAEYPVLPRYRLALATIHNSLGNVLGEMGKGPEAEPVLRNALVILKKLALDFPAVPDYRQELARGHTNLEGLLRALGKRPEAEANVRQALAILDKLAAEFPAVARYRHELAGNHGNLGSLLHELGRLQEAEAAIRKGLSIQEKLAAEYPAVARYRVEVAGSHLNLGNLLLTNQQFETALQSYAKSIDALEAALEKLKGDALVLNFLCNAHLGRAQTLDGLKRYAEAAMDWGKVVELSPEPERPQFRINRATSRLRAGQVDGALQEAEELAKMPHPVILYNAACIFGLAADRHGESGGSVSKEECANRAVALLQQAVAKGWNNAEQTKKDDDFKALRTRDDFKKLVAELEAASRNKP
jgi:serine/threonine-protein kinase